MRWNIWWEISSNWLPVLNTKEVTSVYWSVTCSEGYCILFSIYAMVRSTQLHQLPQSPKGLLSLIYNVSNKKVLLINICKPNIPERMKKFFWRGRSVRKQMTGTCMMMMRMMKIMAFKGRLRLVAGNDWFFWLFKWVFQPGIIMWTSRNYVHATHN